MTFNRLIRSADSRIFRTVGELVTVNKVDAAETLVDVSVVIDRGVEILMGDVVSIGITVGYRETDTGALKRRDTVTTAGGEVLVLGRRLDGDGDIVTRFASVSP